MQALQEALQQEELGAGSGARGAVDALLGRFAAEPPPGGSLEALQCLVDQLYGPALEYRQRGLGLGQALQELQGRLEQVGAERRPAAASGAGLAAPAQGGARGRLPTPRL